MNGDAECCLGERAVLVWWLVRGGNLSDILDCPQLDNGLIDATEFMNSDAAKLSGSMVQSTFFASSSTMIDLCEFIRGDTNKDSILDIADVVNLLSFLYQSGPIANPFDASDANDSGIVDVSDAIYLINYLSNGGPPPPIPFSSLGLDPTPDAISLPCDESALRYSNLLAELQDENVLEDIPFRSFGSHYQVDLDGNGIEDLVWYHTDNREIQITLGYPNEYKDVDFSHLLGAEWFDFTVLDFDQDGDFEIVILKNELDSLVHDPAAPLATSDVSLKIFDVSPIGETQELLSIPVTLQGARQLICSPFGFVLLSEGGTSLLSEENGGYSEQIVSISNVRSIVKAPASVNSQVAALVFTSSPTSVASINWDGTTSNWESFFTGWNPAPGSENLSARQWSIDIAGNGDDLLIMEKNDLVGRSRTATIWGWNTLTGLYETFGVMDVPIYAKGFAEIQSNSNSTTEIAISKFSMESPTVKWESWEYSAGQYTQSSTADLDSFMFAASSIAVNGIVSADYTPEEAANACPRFSNVKRLEPNSGDSEVDDFYAKLCDVIDLINSVGDSTSDSDWHEIADVLTNLKDQGNIFVGDTDSGDEIDGWTRFYLFSPTIMVIDIELFREAIANGCDLNSTKFWELAFTILHEGSHAWEVWSESTARGYEIRFANALMELYPLNKHWLGLVQSPPLTDLLVFAADVMCKHSIKNLSTTTTFYSRAITRRKETLAMQTGCSISCEFTNIGSTIRWWGVSCRYKFRLSILCPCSLEPVVENARCSKGYLLTGTCPS